MVSTGDRFGLALAAIDAEIEAAIGSGELPRRWVAVALGDPVAWSHRHLNALEWRLSSPQGPNLRRAGMRILMALQLCCEEEQKRAAARSR